MEVWRSPLKLACEYKCSIERVRKLLEQGADPNYGGKCAIHPLKTVCSENNFECAKLLLEYGADPNLVDEYGNSPLSSAWGRGHYDCTKLLLDSGARVCYGEWYGIFWRLTDILVIHHRSGTFVTNHKKILDLLFLKREEMEDRLYDILELPVDMIREIHSFL